MAAVAPGEDLGGLLDSVWAALKADVRLHAADYDASYNETPPPGREGAQPADFVTITVNGPLL